MAIASLACSCAGLLFGVFGTIPGIICGARALRQIKGNPGLKGRGLALAGVITGCVLSLIWIPLAIILAVATLSGARAVKQLRSRLAAMPASSATTNEDITADLAPDPAGWMPELGGVSPPDAPVSGRVQGLAFTPTEIELSCATFSHLEFTHRLSTPTREEMVSLVLEFDQADADKYSGRTLSAGRDGTVSVQPQEGWSQRTPRIRMVWIEPGTKPLRERMHDTLTASYPCALRLEFGELKGDQLPGRIYLCLLDRNKSFLRGKFVAKVKRNGPVTVSGRHVAGGRGPDGPPPDTEPDGAGWTLNLAGAVIPDVVATGRVHGVAFKVERVAFQGPRLTLRQGAGFFAERELEILVWDAVSEPGKLSGRTIEVLPDDTGPGKPNVRMSWMAPGQTLPETSHIDRYALRLEFGELKGGRLPCRIYLCLLDYDKSFVRGNFVASTFQLPSAPGPGPTRSPNFPFPGPRAGRR